MKWNTQLQAFFLLSALRQADPGRLSCGEMPTLSLRALSIEEGVSSCYLRITWRDAFLAVADANAHSSSVARCSTKKYFALPKLFVSRQFWLEALHVAVRNRAGSHKVATLLSSMLSVS